MDICGRATIEILPEVIEAVHGSHPRCWSTVDSAAWIESCLKRWLWVRKQPESDVHICGVCGAFGQAGVERVIDIFCAELTLTMDKVVRRLDRWRRLLPVVRGLVFTRFLMIAPRYTVPVEARL